MNTEKIKNNQINRILISITIAGIIGLVLALFLTKEVKAEYIQEIGEFWNFNTGSGSNYPGKINSNRTMNGGAGYLAPHNGGWQDTYSLIHSFSHTTNQTITSYPIELDGGFSFCYRFKGQSGSRTRSLFDFIADSSRLIDITIGDNFDRNSSLTSNCSGGVDNYDNDMKTLAQSGEWVHYCFTVSQTNSYGYFNGEQIWECTNNDAIDFNEKVINRYYMNSENTQSNIDDIILFNKTLSQNEVEIVYNYGEINENFTLEESPPIADPDTGYLGYLNFDPVYNCSINSTCIIKYRYNQNFIPKETNEIKFFKKVDETWDQIATSTIQDLNVFGKSNGISRFGATLSDEDWEIGQHIISFTTTADEWNFSSGPILLNIYEETIPTNIGEEIGQTIEIDINELLDCSSESGLEKVVCNTGKLMLRTTTKIGEIAKDATEKLIAGLKLVFPFNIPIKIYETWKESALTQEMPEEYQWLIMWDEEGNIYMPKPEEWKNEEIEIPIWGPTMINNWGQQFFANIKELIRLLLWVSFTIYIFNIGKDIYNEIRYWGVIDRNRKQDWQL